MSDDKVLLSSNDSHLSHFNRSSYNTLFAVITRSISTPYWMECKSITRLPPALNLPVPKNTTMCPWPGLEPRPLDLESSILIMKPPCLPDLRLGPTEIKWFINPLDINNKFTLTQSSKVHWFYCHVKKTCIPHQTVTKDMWSPLEKYFSPTRLETFLIITIFFFFFRL